MEGKFSQLRILHEKNGKYKTMKTGMRGSK
jgi:hypothetical protein